MDPNEVRDALLGRVVEGAGGVRYHLEKLLGEGGQGWVYLAHYDAPDGFHVVVKVLRPSLHDDAFKRFEREAEVLRRLGSVPAPNPNIVRFYEYGVHTLALGRETFRLPFLTLEYVDGQTLGRLIASQGGFGLSVPRARRIMRQVARALHTVHEARTVHRDLKPSNILVTMVQGQEVAKVTDFGLVKLPDLSTHKTTTVAGASVGYAPPEQYEMGNARVSVQTDVFSFAAVLYEVLSGSEAFPARPSDSPLRVVARMLSGERPGLAKVRATIPRELRERPDLTAALDQEIGRALSGDPGMRHHSIREFWEAVEPYLREAAPRGIEDAASFEGNMVPSGAPPSSSFAPTWRVASRPFAGERLRAAVFSEGTGSLVAVGSHGLYRFDRGSWAALHLPAGVDARFIRSLARLPSGDLVVFGDRGFAMTLGPTGAGERVPIGERDVALLGAFADSGGIVFVGERLSHPVGVVIEVRRGGTTVAHTLEGTVRLHAAARLGDGSLAVCGTHGALVQLTATGQHAITWGRTGHLYSIASAIDGGAFAVGSGGHALRIAPPAPSAGVGPIATLEAVQTTRDITGVTVDAFGGAWAVGSQARLLYRRGGIWTRVPLDASAQGQIVAVSPRIDGTTVVADDGLVLEGPPLHERTTVPPSRA